MPNPLWPGTVEPASPPLPQRVALVLGGARSGKSHFAEAMVGACPGELTYIATAQAYDEEMRQRIAEHQARRDQRWHSLEAPLDLVGALTQAQALMRPTLVDCLTLWLSNQLLAEADLDTETTRLTSYLAHCPGPVVLVSNEVGLSIVPDNALARRFRDAQGRLNQAVAAKAEQVYFIAAGLPLTLKEVARSWPLPNASPSPS